jgi:hypothetical protein
MPPQKAHHHHWSPPHDCFPLHARPYSCRSSGRARDQYAALLPIMERVLGPEHPDTLFARGNLARWAGQAGMRPGPATSTPRCFPSGSR